MKYFIPLLLCAACTSPSTTDTVNAIPTTPDTPSVKLRYPNASTPLEHARNMSDTSDTYTIVFMRDRDYRMLDSAGITIQNLHY